MKGSLLRIVVASMSGGLCAALIACTTPPAAPVAALLHDAYYAPAAPVDPGAVFALSPEMLRYAETELAGLDHMHDARHALLQALYGSGTLHLRYDAGQTRNAAQAFDARAGNCLSLVIMTGAFAKHLGVPVSYQALEVDEQYSRVAGLTLANGHVNLVLGHIHPPLPGAYGLFDTEALTVDFMPPSDLRGARAQPLTESTVLAMYFNNRAAEFIAQGRLDEAYRWARAAVLQDSAFGGGINTLAVIYMRSGHPQAAERALRFVLDSDPRNAAALSNLAQALRADGRATEALAIEARLAQVQPVPPLHEYDLGRQAMRAGDFRAASAHFARELRRQPFQSEVHFWAAQAHWQLGERRQAEEQLRQAIDYSDTLAAHDLYAAKLEKLRSLHLQ